MLDAVRDSVRLAALGSTSLGVWRRRDALRILTRDELAFDLAQGSVQSPLPGVCMDGGYVPSAEQWLAIATLSSSQELVRELADEEPAACLHAVGCGRTAARVHGMPLIDDEDPATRALDRHQHDVAVFRHLGDVRSKRREGHPLDTLHRHQLALDRSDVVQHVSGLWLTSEVRTLFDLTSLVSFEALVCAIDWTLHQGRLRRQELLDFAAVHTGWRSIPAFRRAVDLADGRAESPHETLTRLLLKPGWPQLTPQVRIVDDLGYPVARFDHADEDLRLAVESDGRRGHAGDEMKAKDNRRDRTVQLRHGYHTERVTWFEVRRLPAQTRARIFAVRDALRARRPAA